MNSKRRSRLQSVLSLLSSATDDAQNILALEENCLDNYPENLQSTEAFEKIEFSVESLTEAIDKLLEADELIRAAIA